MNRLPPLSGSAPEMLRPRVADSIDLSLAATACEGGLQHRVFAPLHYEKNYAYPLLVWLHGRGSDERQMIRVMPWISMRNYVALAPRAPWELADGLGTAWCDERREMAQAATGVLDCIDRVISRFHIAPDRLFIAGYQDGGEMALRIALDHPTQFAGAISVNGPFPKTGNPLARLAASRGLPILIAHGQSSTEYPLTQLCDDLRLFHAAGMTVTLRQYPCGDEIHSQMLRDVNTWLMEQVTGQELFCDTRYSPDASPGSSGTN